MVYKNLVTILTRKWGEPVVSVRNNVDSSIQTSFKSFAFRLMNLKGKELFRIGSFQSYTTSDFLNFLDGEICNQTKP